MKKSNKIRVYLDYNVYDGICKNIIDDKIFKNNKLKFFLSVAHAEEYYKALKNDIDNKNYNKLANILNKMISLTPYGVLNPSKTRIINKNEKFDKSFDRVAYDDTGDIVINNGKHLNKIQKEFVANYIECNKKVQNYSNLGYDEIWNQKEVKGKLNEFEKYIEEYKRDIFLQISLRYVFEQASHVCNINYDGFQLKRNCYSELMNNFALLECIVEFLHNLLCECGYNRDKKERTSISGIHDVQHSIYATYCNYFISEDKSFSKRTNAIYNYLGIDTKVITISEFKEIMQKDNK